MAMRILAPTYQLPDADRQHLLSTVPPAIEFHAGVIPSSLLIQSCKLVPSLPKNADIPVHEFERLMVFESVWKRGIFQTNNNGYLF